MKKLYLFIFVLLLSACSTESGIDANTSNAAASGSYANMLAIDDYLYVISNTQIITYEIVSGNEPMERDRQDLGFGIESLFHKDGLLYIGSNSAMHIYSIENDGIPLAQSLTEYNIWDFCQSDPITVDDRFAYATISSTLIGFCQRPEVVNELRVYDLIDINRPSLVNTVSMIEPKGLGIDGQWLFVCERNNGLRVLDISDPLNIIEIHHFDNYEAFDVIPQNGLLLVVGPRDIYQYDYTDMDNMRLLSTIVL